MHRYEWRRRIEQLDPVTECHEIYRIMVAHEFPWDMNQALSFALFRTYAVRDHRRPAGPHGRVPRAHPAALRRHHLDPRRGGGAWVR